MKVGTCRKCFYCEPSPKDVRMGECHCKPPTWFLMPAVSKLGQQGVQKVGGYPPIHLDQRGCAEWKPVH